jgi:hypothetical protein
MLKFSEFFKKIYFENILKNAPIFFWDMESSEFKKKKNQLFDIENVDELALELLQFKRTNRKGHHQRVGLLLLGW